MRPNKILLMPEFNVYKLQIRYESETEARRSHSLSRAAVFQCQCLSEDATRKGEALKVLYLTAPMFAGRKSWPRICLSLF